MKLARLVALLLVLPALAGCGGEDRGGAATLWVTRDRGAELLHDERVEAGLTVLRTLRGVADVETRYGGRFVQSIDGTAGSASGRRDWFFFVNGYESDRGAAEVRVRPGDVVWWDYRSWSGRMRQPVVVGAFPEPFLHGWEGKRRTAVVSIANGTPRPLALRVAKAIGGARVVGAGAPVADGANVLELAGGKPRFRAALRTPGSPPGSPVRYVYAGDVEELLAKQPPFARRYELP